MASNISLIQGCIKCGSRADMALWLIHIQLGSLHGEDMIYAENL